MGTIKTLNKWANAHTYYPLDLLRIGLGIFLFLKGILFIGDSQYLIQQAEPLQGFGGFMLLIHYVAPAHLIGGILIFFGLLTRWAVIAQLPILIGAILVNFIGEMSVSNLLSSVLITALCIFFAVYGSGKHSADYNLKMQQ